MAKNGAPYGERHGKAKHPDSTVREIRDRYYDNGESPAALAREYGVNIETLWSWLKYHTRVHANG